MTDTPPDRLSIDPRSPYFDQAALERFARSVDVATYEFENLPAAPLAVLGDRLRPSVRSLAVSQDRAQQGRRHLLDGSAEVLGAEHRCRVGARPRRRARGRRDAAAVGHRWSRRATLPS